MKSAKSKRKSANFKFLAAVAGAVLLVGQLPLGAAAATVAVFDKVIVVVGPQGISVGPRNGNALDNLERNSSPIVLGESAEFEGISVAGGEPNPGQGGETPPESPSTGEFPPTPEEECVADGGTWNGESCEFPPPPEFFYTDENLSLGCGNVNANECSSETATITTGAGGRNLSRIVAFLSSGGNRGSSATRFYRIKVFDESDNLLGTSDIGDFSCTSFVFTDLDITRHFSSLSLPDTFKVRVDADGGSFASQCGFSLSNWRFAE